MHLSSFCLTISIHFVKLSINNYFIHFFLYYYSDFLIHPIVYSLNNKRSCSWPYLVEFSNHHLSVWKADPDSQNFSTSCHHSNFYIYIYLFILPDYSLIFCVQSRTLNYYLISFGGCVTLEKIWGKTSQSYRRHEVFTDILCQTTTT